MWLFACEPNVYLENTNAAIPDEAFFKMYIPFNYAFTSSIDICGISSECPVLLVTEQLASTDI